MRIFSFIIISLFLSLNILGQQNYARLPLHTPILKDSTIYVSDEQIKPNDLTICNDKFRFRISTIRQTIEIWTNDYLHFEGRLINYAETTKSAPKKYYRQSTVIDSSLASKIYKLCITKKVFQIPTNDSIAGWVDGMDGGYSEIEYSLNNKYSHKKYWAPENFPNIPEAVIINDVYTEIQTILEIHREWSYFIFMLPEVCFLFDGYTGYCITKDENKNK